ncbi:MAG: hypothetical protein MUP19_04845 [Candidatus Aminicenantes bacterium]|nr:hypothetical protein [Candidatus Aminicenantes bacterium]
MAKPYLKKIETVAGFAVWSVDGKHIREKIDEEFTNFGQHYRFRFIPRHEFWIDQERTPGEEHFFVDHLLLENHLMAEGLPYDQALEKADRKERRKADFIQKGIKPGLSKAEVVAKVHKQLLKSYSRHLSVWVADGRLVRDFFFIDYTEGGHDKVYTFIPPREVWLDDDLELKERKFVLLHEVHERFLMTQGLKYFKAHRSASHIEYHCRHHPEELDQTLAGELAKNKD